MHHIEPVLDWMQLHWKPLTATALAFIIGWGIASSGGDDDETTQALSAIEAADITTEVGDPAPEPTLRPLGGSPVATRLPPPSMVLTDDEEAESSLAPIPTVSDEPPPLPRTAPAHTEARANAGRYTLQFGAFHKRADAERLRATLDGHGLDSYIVEAEVGGRLWYRVRSGSFETEQDARAAQSKAIQRTKQKPMVFSV